MRKFACILSVVALFAFAASTAQATLITWGAATNIAGDTDVSTQGTGVWAYSGSTANVAATVNGVTFSVPTTSLFNSTPAWSGPGFGAATTSYGGPYSMAGKLGTLSANYQAVLKYSSILQNTSPTETVTLSNLGIGQQYLVQFWSNASDGARGADRTTLTSGANTVELKANLLNAVNSLGQYVIGTFTADAVTQTFTVTRTGGSYAWQSAIQLRNVTVPEPSTIVLLGMGVMGLLAYAWRKRK